MKDGGVEALLLRLVEYADERLQVPGLQVVAHLGPHREGLTLHGDGADQVQGRAGGDTDVLALSEEVRGQKR